MLLTLARVRRGASEHVQKWHWRRGRLSGREQTRALGSKAPLHPEWAKLVTKELKGKDPQETLTWRTAEVPMSGFELVSRLWKTESDDT
jgi:hypothetical protein